MVSCSKGATSALLLAGCVGSPKVDPCRDNRCTSADTGVPSGGRDAGRDAKQPPIDAETGTELDASRDLDSGMLDTGGPVYDSDAQPRSLQLQGDLDVHDPSIIEANGEFIIFSTGPGIPVKRSTDLITWKDDGSVFTANPAWIAGQVPGASDLWAPDISFFGGQYHLYYSASTFGSRNSCIGHATAHDLTASFEDHGAVICSTSSDDYNAIDPAFVLDTNGARWLAFGSFWSGIKLIRVDGAGEREGSDLIALATRETVQAIEAPYVVQHAGYYYLFVSFDACCMGSASTYRIMVGRSASVTGPYLDAEGKAMLSGGGSMVVLGDQRWRGPGHNAAISAGGSQYLVYHAYDAMNGGKPTLRISELLWNRAGWPLPTGP